MIVCGSRRFAVMSYSGCWIVFTLCFVERIIMNPDSNKVSGSSPHCNIFLTEKSKGIESRLNTICSRDSFCERMRGTQVFWGEFLFWIGHFQARARQLTP